MLFYWATAVVASMFVLYLSAGIVRRFVSFFTN